MVQARILRADGAVSNGHDDDPEALPRSARGSSGARRREGQANAAHSFRSRSGALARAVAISSIVTSRCIGPCASAPRQHRRINAAPAGRASGSHDGSGISWPLAAFSSRGIAVPKPFGILRWPRLRWPRLRCPRCQRRTMARHRSYTYALRDPHQIRSSTRLVSSRLKYFSSLCCTETHSSASAINASTFEYSE